MTDTPEKKPDKRRADGEPTPLELLRAAREQLGELTGRTPETVSRFERTDDGWTVEAEVVEVARVPETMSLMALYEVTLDAGGRLTGYRRVRRYERSRSDRD